MLSPRVTRRAALAGLAGLAACGFVPAYGPQGYGPQGWAPQGGGAPGGAGRLLGQVALSGPATPFGYQVLTTLEDRLGRAQGARYALALTLTLAEAPAAITADGTRTRTTLTGTVGYALTGAATPVTGQLDGFAAYATSGSTVETTAAAADAQQRLAVMLADALLIRLIAATVGDET